jgi:TetR/AcrR family transcriptional regulator, transcriptional repressor for nem operon
MSISPLMARHKEFDRDAALRAAIAVFADHGFEGTSTEDLLRSMGISRQSLYDTFGDKRNLYLEALRQYNSNNVSDLIRTLNTAPSPLRGIEAALLQFATAPEFNGAMGCMGVSAICEFGRSDEEITAVTDAMGRTLIGALERRLTDAQAMGEIGSDLDVSAAAQFIGSTLSGMKVSARAGASTDTLRNIARMALRSLK